MPSFLLLITIILLTQSHLKRSILLQNQIIERELFH